MVHQMVSTVTSSLLSDLDSFHAIEACFPPGSMTGAPKQRSVELLMGLEGGDIETIEYLERKKRGIYSGVAGWISFSKCLNLNVIIRTAVIQNKS